MTAARTRSVRPYVLRRDSLEIHELDLAQVQGLAEVEALMLELARGSREDHAGKMAREQLRTGGKRLRARLALCATAALGGKHDDAVAWAAAVELLHNATLVHDDIQDGDATRRGEPTLWTVHGTAQAINAGDLMLMLPYLAATRTAHRMSGELCRALAAYAIRVVRGQVEELDLLPHGRADWEGYTRAVTGKTGALIGLPVHGAALLAGRSDNHAARLGEAFVPLGVLFQLQDDVLDLYGDKGRGVVGCDLYEGKISALVVAHLERAPSDRDWLLSLLQTPRELTAESAVAHAIAAFRNSGALADVLAHIDALAEQVHENVALREHPGLHRVASNLAALAVSPIEHVRRLGGAP